eukprot:1924134-Amphidinium_carterae.1
MSRFEWRLRSIAMCQISKTAFTGAACCLAMPSACHASNTLRGETLALTDIVRHTSTAHYNSGCSSSA